MLTRSAYIVGDNFNSGSDSVLTDPELDLSLEFLMGRALDNAMLNVGLKDVARGLSIVAHPHRLLI